MNGIICIKDNSVVAFSILRGEVSSLIPFKTAGNEITKTAYSLRAFCSLLEYKLPYLGHAKLLANVLTEKLTLVSIEVVISRFE